MLVAQAKESAEWFTGQNISNDVIANIHKQLRLQMENIILIGMPGCGKSTIGKAVADKLKKTYIDTDIEIVKATGKSIPQIFAESGEDGFRKIETQILAEFGAKSGLLIATGGGCVTRPENYPHLHRNGTMVWIKRDIQSLPAEGRPLSKNGDLDSMYAIRKPLYESFADIVIENNKTVEAAANDIISKLTEA